MGRWLDASTWYTRGLGVVILWATVERWPTLEVYYTDEGILPLAAWREETAAQQAVLRYACLHGWSGRWAWQAALCGAQALFAALLVLDVARRPAAVASLWLYVSATLRHARLAYILDRYVHLELVYAALGAAGPWIDATDLLWWAQLIWIYGDAGWAKLGDPGWTWAAPGLPALDAYVRHTAVADFLRGRNMVTDSALRFATPFVPIVELAAPVLALIASFFPERGRAVYAASVGALVAMHLSIGLTMNGSALLSLAAAVAWLPTLKPRRHIEENGEAPPLRRRLAVGARCAALVTFAAASVRFELFEKTCTDARFAPLSTLVHNRWNVFSGSDDHVVWEIFPARLANGEVVDAWNARAPVSWDIPRRAARCGRWRSFPMVGEGEADDAELDRIYSYFCREANRPPTDPAHLITHFYAYMLRAQLGDATTTKKRLLRIQHCPNDDPKPRGHLVEAHGAPNLL